MQPSLMQDENQSTPPEPQQVVIVQKTRQKRQRQPFAITSFVLGIISAIGVGTAPASVYLFGVCAIIFGLVSLEKKEPKILSLFGIGCSVLGLIATIIVAALA